MRASIILFLILVLVLSYGIANHSTKKSADDDSGDEDDDEYEDDDDDSESESCEKDFVGTNLFGDDYDPNKCFSSTDVALLMARKDFENLLPKDLPKCLLDDHLVEVLMKYFYSANQIIVRMSKGRSKRIVQLAFYDTFGGYLQHYLIPVAKYSFYAGLVKLKTVVNIMQLFNQCKIFLNTNGNGWIEAISDFSEFNLDIEPIKVCKSRNDKGCQSACASLILSDDTEDDMIVPLPKLEREEFGLLSNIWLPFKKKHHFNLRSHSSAFVLLRYYVLVTRCYQFQGVCQDTFNHKFREWYQECIEMHLDDELLYPGLGAVLRIMETLRNRKKYAFIPHEQSERSSGSSKICPFTKTHSSDYLRLKSKAEKLSAQNKQNALNGPLNRGSSITGDVVMFDEDDSPSLKARRKKYITIAVLVSLFLLVFILAVAVLTKYMSSKGIKCKKKKHKEEADNDASGKSEPKSKKDKKHEKEDKKKHDKEEKKHSKEEKKHEKEEKKKHEKEEKKKHEEEKKHEKEEKKKHEEEKKKHEKEEKKKHEEEKKHEKEEKKHEKEEKKHEKEEKKHEKEAHTKGSPSSTDRKEAGSESSTSSSSSSPQRSSQTSRPSPRKFFKGGLKLNLIDEKGRSKKFSISKKNKPIVESSTASPRIRKRSNSMDSGGGMQLHKNALSTSWETIE